MDGATHPRLPIAVLASGSGTNLQALIEAVSEPEYGAHIAIVISDRPDILALQRATAAGIESVVVPWTEFDSRADFTVAVCDAAAAAGADALVLAGFMRILGKEAMVRFPNRILNTHPALLPSFPGAHAIADALEYGAKVTGVTVHFVDEEVDHGPIIYQEAITISSRDDASTLGEKIQAIEHRVYPEVVDSFCRGELAVDGRNVTWRLP